MHAIAITPLPESIVAGGADAHMVLAGLRPKGAMPKRVLERTEVRRLRAARPNYVD